MKKKHALGLLIEQTIERNQWHQSTVVARARQRGHKISEQNISRIKNEPVLSIKPDQIRMLADGLDLPVSVVLGAAIEGAGFTFAPATQGVEEAVQHDPGLSRREKRAILAMVSELRTDEEVGGRDAQSNTAPMNRAGESPARESTVDIVEDTVDQPKRAGDRSER